MFDPKPYVHDFEGRFCVARRQESGRYEVPLPARTAKLSGCGAAFGPLSYVAGLWSYARRADANRRARLLFSESV